MYLNTILIIQVNFNNTFNQIKYANVLFIYQIKWNQIRLSQDTFFSFQNISLSLYNMNM